MEIHPIRLPEAVSTIDANYISSARLLQTPKLLPNRQFWFDDSRYLPANAMIYLAFRGSQETHVELPLKRCLIASEPYASNSRPAEFQTSADNPRGELGIFHAPSQLGLGTVSHSVVSHRFYRYCYLTAGGGNSAIRFRWNFYSMVCGEIIQKSCDIIPMATKKLTSIND